MASLRKDPRGFSKYWYACITVPGKGQTQRCTKVLATERNRGEAMTIAERWEREAKHLGPAIHLVNRAAVLESFVTATQKAIAGDITEADMRELLDCRAGRPSRSGCVFLHHKRAEHTRHPAYVRSLLPDAHGVGG